MNRVSWITLLVTALLFGPSAKSLVGQAQIQPNSRQDPQVVSIFARPFSKESGHFIDGLRKEDFALYHYGVKQDISSISKEDCSVSVVLLLDVSGSMKNSVKLIKDVVTEALKSLAPEDEVALIAYSSKNNVVLEFSKDKSSVVNRIAELKDTDLHGATQEREALYTAATHLLNASNYPGCRFVLVVTDNLSSVDKQERSETEVLSSLSRAGATVYGLIAPSPESWVKDGFGYIAHRQQIDRYVKHTGGTFLYLYEERAKAKLRGIIGSLRKRYLISYKPAKVSYNRKKQEVKLTIAPDVEKREGRWEITFQVAR